MAVNKNYLHSDITNEIIKSASKVHKKLGPGLVEKLYQRALLIELSKTKLKVEREKRIELKYDGVDIGFDRVDFDVDGKILLELKSVSQLTDIHLAQMISYLKASKYKIGLLINFAQKTLQIKRVIS